MVRADNTEAAWLSVLGWL